MALTPVKTPKLIKGMFPNYIWSMPLNSHKTLYLTFDDGPTPDITDWTLETLKKYQAKATFFCIGKNIEKHPEIFQNILNEGHTIGNHTQNHIKGWKTKAKDYITEVEKAQSVMCSETNNHQSTINNLFRPPYGQITPKQGKELTKLGYQVVMWDVLSIDWDKTVTANQCINNVIDHAENGSVVVFHDSIKASKNLMQALPKVLEYFSEKGYVFKAITRTPE